MVVESNAQIEKRSNKGGKRRILLQQQKQREQREFVVCLSVCLFVCLMKADEPTNQHHQLASI